jgi:ABC-type sugar transport system ATPase subunit
MAVVELKSISKDFGGSAILDNISLRIEESEFMVFVGPSGCGKSTMLRIIAGFEQPSSGEVHIGGKNVTELPPGKRDLAMVFQNYALYPNMTVSGNLGFALKNLGVKPNEIDEKVRAVASALQIEPLLDRRPDQLSGGQRQRVAIGRAIIRNPRLYLFDEPLSNVDALLRSQLRVELSALHQRLRTTTIYVTHDQVEAMTLATRIAVLNAGHVEQVGTPLELYNRPANVFVGGFLGSPSMNIFKGECYRRAEGKLEAVIAGGYQIPLPDLKATLEDGERIIIGVRAEDLALVPVDGQGLSVKVTVVERLGSRNIVFCKLAEQANHEMTIAVESTALEMSGALRPDETLKVQIRGRIHVFDANERSLVSQ